MSKKFPEYKGLDLPKVNNEVLKMWDDHDTFRKSLRNRDGKGEFVFYEGPPSANGMPGIHHVMSRAIKDAICRFRQCRIRGKAQAGWDTHGLPCNWEWRRHSG
jgi:isoleucyl-tRNA synthetase